MSGRLFYRSAVEQYTKLKAKVKDGVVETEQADIQCHKSPGSTISSGMPFPPGQDTGGRQFRRSRRVWWVAIATSGLYTQNAFTQSGGVQGVREHEDHVALYYAFRRHADGMFNARTAVTTASPAPIA